MTTLTVKVPDEVAAKLKAVATRRRISKSQIVRDALVKELKSSPTKANLYDIMKEGIGCFDSGVTDLATNPKHMKGFGKWRRE
jgi:predicted transcriptional regulator